MAKPSRQNNIGKSSRTPKLQHAFRNVREPLISDNVSKLVTSLTTGTNGNVTVSVALCPAGLRSVQLSGSTFVSQVSDAPHLAWLYNMSSTFGYYRITRAKLIFVGNAGSTVTGSLNLFGSRDVSDTGAGLNTAYTQGPGSRSFDLASSSSKELSINIPVDSSWKKVSNILTAPGNILPFYGTTSGIININSVGDLCFAGISAQVVSGPASTNVGSLFLDYDVEFKDPMALSMNV